MEAVYLAAALNRSSRVNQSARVAVLASGGGSNLQALLDYFSGPGAAARVELVAAARPGIGALDRASRAEVPSVVLNVGELGAERFADDLLDALEQHRIDLVVLAGYLQLVPLAVVERYRGRMLNIHPALLPAFGGHGMYGMRVHRAVLASGARVTGATVHLVDDRYDTGGIVAQWPVPVLPDDTPERLASRVLHVEHRLLPIAVEAVATGGASAIAAADPLAFELLSVPGPASASLLATVRLPAASPSPHA